MRSKSQQLIGKCIEHGTGKNMQKYSKRKKNKKMVVKGTLTKEGSRLRYRPLAKKTWFS